MPLNAPSLSFLSAHHFSPPCKVGLTPPLLLFHSFPALHSFRLFSYPPRSFFLHYPYSPAYHRTSNIGISFQICQVNFLFPTFPLLKIIPINIISVLVPVSFSFLPCFKYFSCYFSSVCFLSIFFLFISIPILLQFFFSGGAVFPRSSDAAAYRPENAQSEMGGGGRVGLLKVF